MEQINPITFKLHLPVILKVHLLFHSSLLKPYIEDPFPDCETPLPPPVIVEGHKEYTIRQILDSEQIQGKLHYLMTWEGYSPEE